MPQNQQQKHVRTDSEVNQDIYSRCFRKNKLLIIHNSQIKTFEKITEVENIFEICIDNCNNLVAIAQIKDLQQLNALRFTNSLQILGLEENQKTIQVMLKLIQILDLSSMLLQNIQFLQVQSSLKELYLSNNQLSDVSQVINQFSFIEVLSLSFNSKINEDIQNLNLQTLKTLFIDNSNIKELTFLQQCTNIKTLYTNNNDISDSEQLTNYKYLESLQYLQCQCNPVVDNFDYYERMMDNLNTTVIACTLGIQINIEDIKTFKEKQSLKKFDASPRSYQNIINQFDIDQQVLRKQTGFF